ncbi:TPA: ABC transporter substrate binding protein [Streptococcus pneumoniae]
MKNKRLIGIIAALAVLVAGSLIYSSMNKSEAQNNKDEKKITKIGVLQFVSHPSLDLIYKGIQDGLAEEGYKDDQVKIDFMNSEGDQSKVATMSKQLVANGNDLVVGIATPAAQGLASATKDLPVIMAAITDPIELIKALTPNVKTIGALYSSSEDNSKTQVEEFKAYAEKAGLTVETFAVPSTNEIASTVTVMTSKVDAIWVPIDNTIASGFPTVVSSNQSSKKPIYPSATAMVEVGGLASVVIDQHDLGVATGKMIVQVLKGAKPADTPVNVFSTGKSVINKKIAQELGITIPESVLKEAGQVIE